MVGIKIGVFYNVILLRRIVDVESLEYFANYFCYEKEVPTLLRVHLNALLYAKLEMPHFLPIGQALSSALEK